MPEGGHSIDLLPGTGSCKATDRLAKNDSKCSEFFGNLPLVPHIGDFDFRGSICRQKRVKDVDSMVKRQESVLLVQCAERNMGHYDLEKVERVAQ